MIRKTVRVGFTKHEVAISPFYLGRPSTKHFLEIHEAAKEFPISIQIWDYSPRHGAILLLKRMPSRKILSKIVDIISPRR